MARQHAMLSKKHLHLNSSVSIYERQPVYDKPFPSNAPEGSEKGTIPLNITSASLPTPVFMKNCLSVESSRVAVIFAVDALEHPEPPAEDTLVRDGERESSSSTAGSSFMMGRNLEV